MTATETLGFIGLGNQGGPIAMRIAHGGVLPLTVWARRPEVLDDFTRAGATAATSIDRLGSACSLVALCVTTDADVRQVALGPGGLLAAMKPGSSLAVHSTVRPNLVLELARDAAERGISVLDAPVSGGAAGAAAGTMAVLVGGTPQTLDRWRPVFGTFASSVTLVGGIGAGQIVKLVNNAVSSVLLAASLDALGVAESLGLDRAAAFDVMRSSSAGNFMLPLAFDIGPEQVERATSLLRKDVALYQDLLTVDDAAGTSLGSAADAAIRRLETLSHAASPQGPR